MEETNTNNTQQGGNNSMMLIIGALVLAAILGYVVFSSANSNNTESMMTNEDTRSQTQETEDLAANEEISNTSDISEGQVEPMPELNTMELNLNANAPAATEMDTTATNPNVKTVQIEAGSFYYKPNMITVNKGDTVRVVMNSVDMMHDFVIDELNVKLPVTKTGETNTVEFTANQTGTYEFYCSVGQHRQQGQVGTLIVQ